MRLIITSDAEIFIRIGSMEIMLKALTYTYFCYPHGYINIRFGLLTTDTYLNDDEVYF
jgi:hypothetical protein